MGVIEGKRAIVTGAGSGIGRAVAELLAAEGAAVLVVDMNAGTCEAVAAAIRDSGGKAISVVCDVASSADCKRAIETAVREFGGLEILCNIAGIIRRADVVETTEEEWE